MVSYADTTGVGVGSKPKTNNHNVNNGNNNNNHHHLPDGPTARMLWQVSIYTYGLLNWLLYLFSTVISGSFFKQPTEKEEIQFALAQDAMWNLSKQPIPGFYHNFFKTRNGFQFHYLSNQQHPSPGNDLVIMLHGFPNTSMVWRFLLQEPALLTTNATLVAVDLPGFGGSDSLRRYDTQVLELLTEFIIAMRENCDITGDGASNTFIVGHDWGCAIGMRLAAEAPCLADRFIFTNGPLVELTMANIGRALNSSRRIFKQFQLSPRANFGCLAKSFHAIKPLLHQLVCSGYMAVFQLPAIFVKYLGNCGNNAFLKGAYRGEHGKLRDELKIHETFVANFGPGIEECKTRNEHGATYGPTVAQRIRSVGDVFWETTGYYRHGLGIDPWEKSIETIAALYNIDTDVSSSASPARRRSSSASSAMFNDHYKDCLRAPSTILWGEKDIALTKPICLDGIGDYLAKESEVILLPNGGHWIQIEKPSRRLFAQVIAMFANGPSKQTPSYIAKDVLEMDNSTSLMVKR